MQEDMIYNNASDSETYPPFRKFNFNILQCLVTNMNLKLNKGEENVH